MNLEFAGGGEANARDIAELFVRQGYDVTLFGAGIPKGYETKAGKYSFNYVPDAFTFSPLRLLILIWIGVLFDFLLI